MARLFAFLLLMFVITFPLSTNAEEHRKVGMLDIIPHNTAGAIAIKSIEETGQHFNNFSNDTNIRPTVQPAMALQMALAWLGAVEGLDRKSPIALILPDARKLKNRTLESIDNSPLGGLVIAIPYRNLNLLARNFNTSTRKLKSGATVKGKGITFGKFFKVRGKHLYLGNNKKMLEDVVAAKSAATKMTAKQIKQANNADALLLIGTRAWGREWDALIKEIENDIKRLNNRIEKKDDKTSNHFSPYTKEEMIQFKYLETLLKSLLNATEFGVFTIQYNKGIGVSGMAVFQEDKTGERQKALESIRGSRVPSSLNELPNDNLLFAYGHSAYTQKVSFLLTSTLLASLEEWAIPRKWISEIKKNKNYIHFKKSILQQSNGRGVIYLNRGQLSKGWVSATSIFEPKQAGGLLALLKKKATKINPAKTNLHLDQFDGKSKKPTVSKEGIAKLIKLLGDTNYKTRTSATNKLLKIGDDALTALQKAKMHRDIEIALRAEQVVELLTDEKTRRKGLPLIPALLANATYHYTPQAETIGGEQVDIISLRSTKLNPHNENYLKQLLGTNWKHIRVVHVKNKIVIHWGSDTTSLQKTIKNIQEQKTGLAEHPSLKEHQQFSSHPQKMQLHFSLTNIIPFFLEDSSRILKRREKKTTPFSSISMTIDGEQFQSDVWVPKQDLKNALDGQKFEDMNQFILSILGWGLFF